MNPREPLLREFQRDRLRLAAYVRSLVGDPDLTEEILQEVTLVILQKAGEFIPGRDLQAWSRGIARNLILRERKKAWRLRPFPEDRIVELVDRAFEEDAGQDLADAQRSLLRESLASLPSEARELLTLRYARGLSLREIAHRLGKSEAAAQVALSRLRRRLLEGVRARARLTAGLPA